MTTDKDIAARSPFEREDLALLELVRRGGDWLRGVLCTLARRGVAFRQSHPERAQALLDALAAHPFYKAGQFLFDLMEWEDFMLDGPPPPLVPTALDARSLQKLAELLASVRTHLDGAPLPAEFAIDANTFGAQDENLPPLEGGFYLYADVVLGALRSAAPLLNDAATARA